MIKDILQKLYTIDHIPSHPSMKNNLQEIISKNSTQKKLNIENLTRFISYDPSLTIEFLRLANSDSFGFKSKISSIHNALLLLDRDLIQLIISQHPIIPDLKVYHTGLEHEFLKLIKHSIEVHIIVQYILNVVLKDRMIDTDLRKKILTASTLHDIGLFFLLIYFPDNYVELINIIRETEVVQRKKKGGFTIPDHSLIGSVLCEFWKLPAFIRTSISFHHYPWAGDEDYTLGSEILYLADTISSSFYELYHFDDVYTIDEHIIMRRKLLEIVDKLKIDITKIADIRIQSLVEVNKLYPVLGI